MRQITILMIILAALTFSIPAFAANPSQSQSGISVKHIVRANENLSQIASFYQVSVQNIVSANKLADPNKLHIGQSLLIPQNNTGLTNGAANNNRSPNDTQMAKYVVKARDTLSSIARAHGIPLNTVISANKTVNPNSLQIGQIINLPASAGNTPLASRSDDGRTKEIIDKDNELALEIISFAKEFLGCAYSYGADGPRKFDCSGFTMYVFKKFNIDLPHHSASQANKGTKVKKSDLMPGDLVFFKTSSKGISHVGLYVGNGDFIHASTGGRKVEITSLSDTYYHKRYVTARRILE